MRWRLSPLFLLLCGACEPWEPDFDYDELTCDHVGFDEATWSQAAGYFTDPLEGLDPVQSWGAQTAGNPHDEVACSWYDAADAQPGEYAFTQLLGRFDGVRCTVSDEFDWDVDSQSGTSRARLLAVGGTIHLTEGGSGAQRLVGSLEQVLLLEADFEAYQEPDEDCEDEDCAYDGAWVLVPRGERWCLPEFAIDADIKVW